METTSAFSEKYYNARMERLVPSSVLVDHLMQFRGKPDEEQVKIKDRLAEEILAKYPYRKGKEPKETEK